jgi:hypothetical protein
MIRLWCRLQTPPRDRCAPSAAAEPAVIHPHSLTGRRRVPQPGAFSRRNLQLLNSERFDGLARLALISPHQLRLKNDKIQSPLQQQYVHHLPAK